MCTRILFDHWCTHAYYVLSEFSKMTIEVGMCLHCARVWMWVYTCLHAHTRMVRASTLVFIWEAFIQVPVWAPWWKKKKLINEKKNNAFTPIKYLLCYGVFVWPFPSALEWHCWKYIIYFQQSYKPWKGCVVSWLLNVVFNVWNVAAETV